MVKRLVKKGLIVFSLISSLIIVSLVNTKVVFASVSLPDGAPITDPYGSLSSVPSYYDSVSYYDCFIPYQATIAQIGGESTGCKQITGGNLHKCNREGELVGTYVRSEAHLVQQSAPFSFPRGAEFDGGNIGNINSDKLQIAKTKNGDELYIITLTGFFWKSPSKFENYGENVIGTLVDIILTDGTCIHAVVGDYREDTLTNGGDGTSHQGYTDETNTTWRCHNYTGYFQPLNYPVYQNLFQAANGEIFGICGASNAGEKFCSKYNIKLGGAYPAAIRVYDAKIGDDVSRTASAGNGVDCDLGGATLQSMGTKWGSSNLGVAGSNLVAESDLVGMPHQFNASQYQANVSLVNREDLDVASRSTLATIGTNIDLIHEATILDYVRIGITFIGLALIFYSFLLVLALLFDKANNFVDISLVHVVTFGGFSYDPFSEIEGGKSPKGYVTAKKLIIVAVIVMLSGFLIMSGGFFKLYGNLLYNLTKLFN